MAAAVAVRSRGPGKKAVRHPMARLPTQRRAAAATFLLLVLVPRSPRARDDAMMMPWLPSLPRVAPASASSSSSSSSSGGILSDLLSSAAERIFPPEDDVDDESTRTLDIMEISAMRARDIKRRLARSHGYDPDELSRMIDKKDLINSLSFEEHKARRRGADRRKWRRIRTTMICTCAAVIVVVFWPLVRHALEVAHVNFVVYADRRRHEIGRCRDFDSPTGYLGIFLLFIIDALSLWLSISVLLSWVMSSRYFFPVPSLPIRPAQLLTPTGGDAGALGKYGINVGPMLVSWSFRFLNGRVEAMIGRAMSDALKRRRRREKDEAKRARREEKERDREARGRANVARGGKAATAPRRDDDGSEEHDDNEGSDGEDSYSGMTPSNVSRVATSNFHDLD